MSELKDRISDAGLKGFLDGVNCISRRPERFLYDNGDRRAADCYIRAIYDSEYLKGQDERAVRDGDVIPIDADRVHIHSIRKKMDSAFRYGAEAKRRSAGPDAPVDDGCDDILKAMDNEEDIMMVLAAWITGFDSEDVEIDEEATPGLDYGKMRSFRELYEKGLEPDPGTEEHEAFRDYRLWADNLKFTGKDECVKCLSCCGLYRIAGDGRSACEDETYSGCEMDCARAYETCSLESWGYMEHLTDFFTGRGSDSDR
ncbi:MAG: hypothetical protein K6G81_13015 [Lachnospiraceae bacterium]|nr:hypothetical protein [Lachnospiraceae bacterium]